MKLSVVQDVGKIIKDETARKTWIIGGEGQHQNGHDQYQAYSLALCDPRRYSGVRAKRDAKDPAKFG